VFAAGGAKIVGNQSAGSEFFNVKFNHIGCLSVFELFRKRQAPINHSSSLDCGFWIAASGPWGLKGLRPGGICCIALLYHFLLN
jgi:hypothetical protein